MPHTICTFNVNNLFVRYRFSSTYPRDVTGRSAVEEPMTGYFPLYNPEAFDLFNPLQRALAAMAATQGGTVYPDVICLQEVESLIALRRFNETGFGGPVPPGHPDRLPGLPPDRRGGPVQPPGPGRPVPPGRHRPPGGRPGAVAVAVLTGLPGGGGGPGGAEPDPVHQPPEVEVHRLDEGRDAPGPGGPPARDDAYRGRQAEAVRRLVHQRFPGAQFGQAFFAVVGDLNDEPTSAPLAPLVTDAGLIDVLGRIPGQENRWTHWYRSENKVSQIDQVLVSPALDRDTTGSVPHIERRGVSFSRILQDGGIGPRETHFNRIDDDPNPVDVDFRFSRFTGVSPDNYASDHCPVLFEVP